MATETVGDKKLDLQFSSIFTEHLDQVTGIEKLSFAMPWSRQAFTFEITENDFALYLVALFQDRVVGYGGIWIVLDEGHITNVAVHPKLRGYGVGRALMAELISRAAMQGADKLTLEVRMSNLAARNLYASLGFVGKGVRRRYYSDNNEDALIMWLYLNH